MTEPSEKRLELEIEGTFDSAQIERILRAIDSAPGQPVALDFRKVARLHDSALVLLARALAERRADASFLGLSRHHVRLLRYMEFPF